MLKAFPILHALNCKNTLQTKNAMKEKIDIYEKFGDFLLNLI